MKSWQEKSWILTIPVAAVAAAYVWFFFLPDKRFIAQQRGEMDQKLAFSGTSTKISADIARVHRQLEATEAYVHRWESVSADPVQVAGVFKSIAEVAKQSGVQTTRFVPDPVVKMESMERIPLKFGCRGKLDSIFTLLAGLERLQYRLWIEELTLEPTGKDGEIVQCDIVLAIFASNHEKSG